MTKTKHSPTPWRVDGDAVVAHGGGPDLVALSPANDGWEESGAMFAANAEHIVRCVNAHDDLVAGLKSAVESLESLVRLGRIPASSKGLRDAKEALAKAGVQL